MCNNGVASSAIHDNHDTMLIVQTGIYYIIVQCYLLSFILQIKLVYYGSEDSQMTLIYFFLKYDKGIPFLYILYDSCSGTYGKDYKLNLVFQVRG